MREVKFQSGEYYHIYNRGVDKREIFMDERDFVRFLRSMREFNCVKATGGLHLINQSNKGTESLNFRDSVPLIELICYCLLPNHYHFILKQLIGNGVSEFIKRLATGYTTYFNQRYDRSGVLFQGPFKAIHIATDEYSLWLSGYVNGNIEIHKIAKADSWPWSSCKDYLGLRNGMLCNKNIILKGFENLNDYQEFVNMVIKESGERKDEIKNYFLE